MQLPTEKKKVIRELWRYIFLIYGREKIGKSVLASQFPDVVFMSTEPVTKGLEVFDFNHENGGLNDWDEVLEAIKLLEGTKNFKCVCIDTVDRMYDMCMVHVCKQLGISYPGLTKEGKTEKGGMSWFRVRNEFYRAIHRIVKTGRGVIFTSHSKDFVDDEKNKFVIPTMSGQAMTAVKPIVDFAFYAEHVRIRTAKGFTDERILLCEGNVNVWAGHRNTINTNFPKFLPLRADKGYEILEAAFLGNEYSPVIDPKSIHSTTQTADAFGELLRAI